MPLFKVMYLRTWRLVNVKWFYLLLYSIALKVFFSHSTLHRQSQKYYLLSLGKLSDTELVHLVKGNVCF